MPEAATGRARQGPGAVLLLLVGLILGSVTGAAARDVSDSSISRLPQARAAKGVLTLRTAARDLAVGDERDLDLPFIPPPPVGIVTRTVSLGPAQGPWIARDWDRPQRLPAGYRARAPPAV